MILTNHPQKYVLSLARSELIPFEIVFECLNIKLSIYNRHIILSDVSLIFLQDQV